MSRSLPRLVVLFSALFVLFFVAIRARPYSDKSLNDFLFNSPGCENYPDEPCFMGLRPGLTTAEQARLILETHEWLDHTPVAAGQPAMYFRWSANVPQPLLAQCSQSDYGGIVYLDHNRVTKIVACSSLSLGALFLSIGTPDEAFTYVPNPNAPELHYWFVANYAALGLGIEGPVQCPASTRLLWDVHGSMTFRQPAPTTRTPSTSSLDAGC